MSDRNTEDIIGALYDLVQDARAMPLAADKCIVERDRVLDMLDEIIAQLPVELKQARTIVESRNELISQARREAETVLRQAQEQAKVEAKKIIDEAKVRIQEEKEAALRDVRKEVAIMSVAIAEEVVKKELSTDKGQMELIDRMIKEMS